MKNSGITNRILLMILFGSLLWTSCSSSQGEDESQNKPDEQEESVEVKPEVTFAVADDKSLYNYIESQGVVEANQSVVLKPRISGFVDGSGIREGRRVQKGDTLLHFVDDEWAVKLQQAENNYQKARNAYRIEMNMRDSDTSHSERGTDGKEDKSEKMVAISTGFAEAQLNLKKARLDMSYTIMVAPFTGKLHAGQRYDPGTYLTAGTELGELVDDRTVRIRFDVLESELNQVKPGMEVKITSPSNKVITGMVEAVSPVVDPKSKTGKVVVRVDNQAHQLTPGMTVDGRIRTQAESGKARIPRSALLEREGRTLVFKLNPSNDEVSWVYVKPVAQNRDWAIVNNKDIVPGDTIAVDHHFALSHLQKVTPRMESLQKISADTE